MLKRLLASILIKVLNYAGRCAVGVLLRSGREWRQPLNGLATLDRSAFASRAIAKLNRPLLSVTAKPGYDGGHFYASDHGEFP
ncbi:hypothetical protein [Pseudomonas cavernicola]|uniref:hypothetical protein n=1 Tax=Pseudomonas cavernicola TaxID=2320866 RepID=UPI0011C38362|nr:hypothetical protein [Pseudomonas cavernicola]